VLAGEEIPDLFARRVADHPETDPFLRDVNRYHRQEEARHIAFARGILPELWSGASRRQRARIRRVAPFLIRTLFESFVHPGVYGAVGLPAWRTWIAVNRSPSRIGLRHEASRPLVTALLDAGVFRPGRVPRAWRRLAGVNRDGAPAA
jgi:hypothetical protein